MNIDCDVTHACILAVWIVLCRVEKSSPVLRDVDFDDLRLTRTVQYRGTSWQEP